MRIAVIGTGHVGLVTGVALASLGHRVAATDADRGKVGDLQRGKAPFFEPGLDALLTRTLREGRIRFSDGVAEAVHDAELAFVCVGRPPVGNGDRSLGAVEEAVRAIARSASDGVVLVVKSTVPPGTTDRVQKVMVSERPELRFDVCASPEFLREGHALEDTLHPDRVVIGSDSSRANRTLKEAYADVLRRGTVLIETDARSAELAKLASNAFLALKVSYANALARLSERVGAHADDVTAIMGADERIGSAFLEAGAGYGGYCLPKDVATLERLAARAGYDFGMLREADRVNREALEALYAKVEEAVWNLEGKTVALLGLAFKPGTDDVRAAPALALAERLLADGARVVGFDPLAGDQARRVLPALEVASDPYAAAEGAHCALIATEWPEFRDLDLVRLGSAMAARTLVDGRNMIDPACARAAGFDHFAVGSHHRDMS
jgi:UDPglucose 6-dehydrogenase